jgi:endo-1,4-beta-xylanase
VSDLSVPDPRVTNTELFDLLNPNAPIPQFVNAMKMAGIDVSAEQIAQGITYVSTKADGAPLIDKDGNPFVVAVYNLDPSLFPEKYRELAGPIPLMIAEKGEGGWEWKKISLKSLSEKEGIFLGSSGAYLDDPKFIKFLTTEFHKTESAFEFQWSLEDAGIFRPAENKFNFNETDKRIRFANKYGLRLQVLSLIWGNRAYLPNWLLNGNFSREQYQEIVLNHIETVVSRYKGEVEEWAVINELQKFPWEDGTRNGYWDQVFKGDHEWIFEAFKKSDEIDPESIKFINDAGIEFFGGEVRTGIERASTIYNIVKEGRERGLNINVGFQCHLYGKDYLNPTVRTKKLEAFRRMIQEYHKIGAEVLITELDIRMNEVNLSETEKLKLQAQIYQDIIKIVIEEGITSITFFGVNDGLSWLNELPGADATMFDSNYSPKAPYYSVLQSFYDYLRNASK